MPQSLRETLTAALDFIQGGDQMGPGVGDRGHLARVGQCLSCGHAVADHWDAVNRFLGCVHAHMVARRAASAQREQRAGVRGEAPGERGPS